MQNLTLALMGRRAFFVARIPRVIAILNPECCHTAGESILWPWPSGVYVTLTRCQSRGVLLFLLKQPNQLTDLLPNLIFWVLARNSQFHRFLFPSRRFLFEFLHELLQIRLFLSSLFQFCFQTSKRILQLMQLLFQIIFLRKPFFFLSKSIVKSEWR